MILPLHDYQRIAVEFLQNTPHAYLALDMGLGKSAISLSALTKEDLPVLIVAPKRVAELVWPIEHKKWRPDLSFTLAAGDPKKRLAELSSNADIVVLGRDNLKDLPNNPNLLEKFKTVIYDEASGLKGRGARWELMRKIVAQPQVANVWAMSGTPAPNGLGDLWSQFFILDSGERLGRNITTFRSRYFRPGRQLSTGVIVEWLLKPEADKRIHEAVEDISLGMTSEYYLDLPPVTYNNISVQLSDDIKQKYEDFRRTLVADLEVLGGEIHTAANAAVLTGKLSQIAAGGLYVDEADLRDGKYAWIHDTKLDALEEILEGTGSNVLAWYNYKFELEQLLKRFKFARTATESGAVEAWTRGEVKLLLAHPASAGMGLNLAEGGHTAVWLTPSWNLEHYAQSNARLHRQGQTNPVVIHHVLAAPIDYAIMERLANKTSVQDAFKMAIESVL